VSFENCVLKNVEKKYDWEKNKERKTMKETKQVLRKSTAAIVVLVLLLFSSSFVMLGTAVVTPSSIIARPITTTDYGDIMQYEAVAGENNQNQDGFSAGPAPDVPNVLWQVRASGSGYISVFNGKAFVISGSTLRAYDAFTGSLVWTTNLTRSASGTGGTKKIDNTYLFVDCNGPEVHRISDGSFVSNFTLRY